MLSIGENWCPEDGDYVTCRKCCSEFHYNCSGHQKSSWEKKSARKKAEWECENCSLKPPRTRFGSQKEDEIEQFDDPVYSALKGFIEKMFEKQEKLITERVDRITTFMSTLEERFNEMYDKIQKLEEDRDSFKEELDHLKVTLECERQYGRSKNMIITSIPYSDKEDVSAVIIKLLSAMDITLKREEFTAHRLPTKKGPPPIIVQCCTRGTRDYVVRKARKLRPTVSLITNGVSNTAIYFNDHLTPYFASLMAEAKQVKAQKGYKYIWLNGNKIMLRKDNLSQAVKVEKPSDLDKLT